jgi:NADH-quinone oxidoreductase subunit G
MRILPRNHDGVNEEWLADRSRYVWDGLRRQRLDTPYVRENGKLRPASWAEALGAAAAALKGAHKIAGLVGDLAPAEAAFALKQLVEGSGGAVECRVDGAQLPAGNRGAYAGTARIEDIDGAEAIMLIGTNPRAEAPVLNARIRGAWTRGATVGLIGEAVDLTYEYAHLGDGPEALEPILAGDHAGVRDRPSLVIVGQAALRRADGAAVLAAAQELAESTRSGLLVLHTAASRVGALDLGATTDGGIGATLEGADVVYSLGADECEIAAGPTVIYQGSHGDRGAHRADIILPAAAWTEEPGLFVNTEGRPQLAMRAGFPPGEAKENWAILRALSGELGTPLPYDSLARLRAALVAAHPHLGEIDEVPANDAVPLERGAFAPEPFGQAVEEHYLTNPIARASRLMGELAAGARARSGLKVAAE